MQCNFTNIFSLIVCIKNFQKIIFLKIFQCFFFKNTYAIEYNMVIAHIGLMYEFFFFLIKVLYANIVIICC